jgi:hypothetical protein
MPGRSHRGPLPPADDRLVEMAAEIRRHVERLASEIGERNVTHRPRQLAQAADYIDAELSGLGYEVGRQGYDVGGTTCFNLDCEIAGQSRPAEIVLVGAHYDSVPGSPAANDNASGLGALLVLAKQLSGSANERTLRFVAFVNEEAPYAHTPQMGSWVYARRCRQRDENIVAMLSLETIGYYDDTPGSQKYPHLVAPFYPSRGDFIGIVGSTRFARLVRQVVAAFRASEPFPCEGAVLPEAMPSIGRSDHWSFWQEGYPALMVTDTAPFRYPHYHRAEDTADKVDADKTARVVRGLANVLAKLLES